MVYEEERQRREIERERVVELMSRCNTENNKIDKSIQIVDLNSNAG